MNPLSLRQIRRKGGYILFEAVVSMGVLSMSVMAINGAMQQAILVKGQAQDYTNARFMLEEKIAEIELQPTLLEAAKSGKGKEGLERFDWKTKVSKIALPQPPAPAAASATGLNAGPPPKMPSPFLVKIEAVVTWTRAGVQFEERMETLWPGEKLWRPPANSAALSPFESSPATDGGGTS